jgi:hypothetical protein
VEQNTADHIRNSLSSHRLSYFSRSKTGALIKKSAMPPDFMGKMAEFQASFRASDGTGDGDRLAASGEDASGAGRSLEFALRLENPYAH